MWLHFFFLVFLKQHSLLRLEYDYEGSNYYVWNKKHRQIFMADLDIIWY